MNRWSRFILILSLICATASLSCVEVSAAPSSYEALVQHGNSQLQAGNNDDALASAKAAIGMNPSRWEGYALEGGALINLGRCGEAQTALFRAIKRAPDAKLPGLQTLLGQCQSAASAPGAASAAQSGAGPSYADTVRYIQEKIKDAGFIRPPGQESSDSDSYEKLSYGQAKYSFSVDGCQSMTIAFAAAVHVDEYSVEDRGEDRLKGHEESKLEFSYTVPFTSVSDYTNYANWTGKEDSQLAAIFSTHEPIQNLANGNYTADGYLIGGAMNGAPPAGPVIQAMRDQLREHEDWHDAVWVVSKDLGISWVSSDPGNGQQYEHQSGHIIKSGVPGLLIRFSAPGTGATSTHIAKALRHLVDYCRKHPEQQGSKDPF